MKQKLKKIIQFVLNPRLILCWGLAWLITNGWSYIMVALGTYFGIPWMIAVSSAYLAFLWLPISPEKLVTFTIAIFLLRLLFPNDKKTLGTLRELREKLKIKKKEHDEKKHGNEANGSKTQKNTSE